MDNNLHKCKKCFLNKDCSNFYIRENGKLRNECKDCLANIRLSKKEHIAKKKREWQQNLQPLLKHKHLLKTIKDRKYAKNMGNS